MTIFYLLLQIHIEYLSQSEKDFFKKICKELADIDKYPYQKLENLSQEFFLTYYQKESRISLLSFRNHENKLRELYNTFPYTEETIKNMYKNLLECYNEIQIIKDYFI